MRSTSRWTRVVLALLCAFGFLLGSVQAKEAVYQTGFDEWLAAEGDLAAWHGKGTRLSRSGELVLNPTAAVLEDDPYDAGTYHEGNFYTGGTYWVGEATGPITTTDFDFD